MLQVAPPLSLVIFSPLLNVKKDLVVEFILGFQSSVSTTGSPSVDYILPLLNSYR